MAKWCGKIGYALSKEVRPGYWKNEISEREYYGDMTRCKQRNETSAVNGGITLSNELSIVADPFAYENFYAIKWVEYMGTKWAVQSVETQYPRLILTIGGVYNDCAGETT